MKYRVEARTADTKELCDWWYANSLDDASDIIENQRAGDYAYGESDCYEYEIIPMN